MEYCVGANSLDKKRGLNFTKFLSTTETGIGPFRKRLFNMHIDDFMRKTTKYSRIELIKKEPAGVRAMSLNGKLKGRSQKRGSSAEQ